MPTIYKEYLEKHATLVLNTGDATANDAYGSDFTWKNINLRNLMGDMYDEFEYFSLQLTAIAVSRMQSSVLASHDKCLETFMTGLNWKNCNYDCKTNALVDFTMIAMFQYNNINSNTGNTIIFQPSYSTSNCFMKSQTNICTLNMKQYIIQNNKNATGVPSNYASGAVYPPRAYIFKIVPIKTVDEIPTNLFIRGYDFWSTTGGIPNNNVPNVNLRTLLGELYDKYDTFNIEIINLQSTALSVAFDNVSRVPVLKIYGLPLYYCNYDVGKRCLVNNAICGYIDLTGTSSTQGSYYVDPPMSDTLMFKKPNDNVNLKITLTSSNDDSLNIVGINKVSMQFKIMPVNSK